MLYNKKDYPDKTLDSAVMVPQQEWPMEFVDAVAKRISDGSHGSFVLTPENVEWVISGKKADERFFYLKVEDLDLVYQANATDMSHVITRLTMSR